MQILGRMSQTLILDSGPNFDAGVALATNGNLDPMNFKLEYLDGTESFALDWPESSFYGVPGDLSGFTVFPISSRS